MTVPFGAKDPCPICGRTKDSSCSRKPEDGLIYCWYGSSFTPPDAAISKVGKVHKAQNGLEYAYLGDSKDGGWAMFRPHEEREPVKSEWTYKDVTGQPAVVVHRIDDHTGKRMWQKPIGKYIKVPERSILSFYGEQGDITFLVEGEKTVDAMRSAGFAAVCVIGGSTGDVSVLPTSGKWVLCPDRDMAGIGLMVRAWEHLRSGDTNIRWCYAGGPDKWDGKRWDGYDMADWLTAGATAEDIRGALHETLLNWDGPAAGFWDMLPRMDKYAKIKPDELLTLITQHYGNTLRFNELTKRIEIDGEPQESWRIDNAHYEFAKCNIQLTPVEARSALVVASRANAYHPVREYLDSCVTPLSDDDWENIAGVLLGGDPEPFDNSALRKWLTSAVARIYEPGQRSDFMHILAGEGNLHKTRFYMTLCGPEWFCEGYSMSNSDKDNKLILHRHWIVEMGELDGLTKKKEVTELKNFITTKRDTLRLPYASGLDDLPRSCVLCGTTNKLDGFLMDDTGNRRYVVYPINRRIDVSFLDHMRDRVWASARRDYLNNVDWNLSAEEAQINEARNNDWMVEDSWVGKISSYLAVTRPAYVYLPDMLPLAIPELQLKDIHQGILTRGNRIMSQLGWRRGRMNLNGGRVNVWRNELKSVSDRLSVISGDD